MTTSTLVNNVKVVSQTVGTGTLTLGANVEGYAGIADLINGATYSYSVHQDALWEYGRGVFNAISGTLTRGVLRSFDGTAEGTSPVALGPGASIAVGVLLVEDLSERVGIPANFTIGTVTELPYGTPPYVHISGTTPNFVLDIGLEAGPPGTNGTDGVTPTFTAGTITSLSPGTTPTFTFTGTPPNYVLNLGLPAGATGATGAVPVFTIGTVTAGAAGVTVTGTATNPILNFVLQTGATGATGGTGQTGATGAAGRDGIGSYVTQLTYAALSAITPSAGAGTTGFSTGPDTGTHTDANGLVNQPNVGQFFYQASPAGWIYAGPAVSPSDPAVLAALVGFTDTQALYGVPNVTGVAATVTRASAINVVAGKSGNLDYIDVWVMTAGNGQGIIRVTVPNTDGTTVEIIHRNTFGVSPYTAVAATGAIRLLAGTHFPTGIYVPSGATIWVGGDTGGTIISLDTGTAGVYLDVATTGIAITPLTQGAIARARFGISNPVAVKTETDANKLTANQANLFASTPFSLVRWGKELQTALSAVLTAQEFSSTGYPIGNACFVTGVEITVNQTGTFEVQFWKPTSATTGIWKASKTITSGTTNTITGSISGTTLTVTAGTVFIGNTLSGGPTTCVITDYGTIDGTYVVSVSQTYASGSITVTQTGKQDCYFDADVLVEADWVIFVRTLTGRLSRVTNSKQPGLFMNSPDYLAGVWANTTVEYQFRPILKLPKTAKQLAADQQRKSTVLTRQTFPGTATPTGATVTGNTTSGSANLTLTAGVVTVGQIISGTGIPANTTILSGSPLTNIYVMSANATATNVGIIVTPVDWVLGGWTVNDGLISPAAGSNTTFAKFNYKTCSDRRRAVWRVTLHTPTAVWGAGYDGTIDTLFYNNGTLAVIDGSAGAAAARLRLYAWNGTSALPSLTAPKPGKTTSIAIPFTLVADREYTVMMEKKRNRTVVTLTDTFTLQAAVLDVVSTTSSPTGDNSPNYGLQYGCPGMVYISGSGSAGDVICSRFELIANVSQAPHAIFLGHSGCDNSQLGDQMFRGYPYLLDEARGRGDIMVAARAGDATTPLMARLALDLNKFNPKYVVFDDGVNFESVGQSEAAGLAAFQANVPQLVAWAQRLGATPVFVTGSPWISYPSFVASKNTWIRAYCKANNLPYIDFAKAVSVDNADGAYLPLYDYGDGTHPSLYGAIREYQACLTDAPYLADVML